MNRRLFLQQAAMAIAGVAIDPERLLWIPGAKTIFIPVLNKPSDFIAISALLEDYPSPRAFAVGKLLGYSASLTVDRIIREEIEWQRRISKNRHMRASHIDA